jgi:acyl-CoA thioesterase-1
VLVVPAQYAANKAWRAKPDLVLHSKYLLSDIHPGPRGSYLIACLVYATLFDRSPVGLPALTMHNERYSAANNEPSVTLTAEEARACQDAAWATYQDFKVAVAAAKDPYAVKTPLALVIGMPSAGGGSPLRDPMRALPGRATLFTPGGDSTVARALADADDYLGKESWKTVVLSLGHADAIAKTPEADYVRDLTALVKRLKATGATLVWLGAFPHPSKDPQAVTLEALQSYNAAARKVLEAEGVTIAELYDVAVTDAKAAEPKKMNADVDAAWKIIGMAAVECLKTPTRGVN